jgi:hypothetical protein
MGGNQAMHTVAFQGEKLQQSVISEDGIYTHLWSFMQLIYPSPAPDLAQLI